MSGDVPIPPSTPDPEQNSPTRRRGMRGWIDDTLAPPEFYAERKEAATSWLEAFLQPICLVTVITSFLLGFIQFGLALIPTWNTIMLVPLIIIAATTGYLYSRRLARAQTIWRELLVLLLPVLLIVRFAPYLEWGADQLIYDIQRWFKEPADFFDPTFIVNTLVVLSAWQLAFGAAQILNVLRPLRQEIAPTDVTSVEYYMWESSDYRNIDRASPLRNLTSRWLWGGVLLLVMASLASIGVRQLFSADMLVQIVTLARPGLTAVYLNVILYFVAGLILISQAQFTRLRSTWIAEQVAVTTNLATRWFVMLAAFVGLALLIALILPTEQTAGIQEIVRSGLFLLAQLAGLLYFLIFSLFGIILAPIFWLLSLFGKGDSTSEPAAQPILPQPPPPTGGDDFIGTLRSLALWILILCVLIYALWHFAARSGLRSMRLPRWRIVSFIGNGLRWFWSLVRGIGQIAGDSIGELIGRLRNQAGAVRTPFRYIALRRLGPRQLVEYFYLSILERANRLGYGRKPGQTASEFTASLQQRLPEVDPDLEQLTAAFLEARYSPHRFDQDEVKEARSIWQRLRDRLQRLRRIKIEGRDQES